MGLRRRKRVNRGQVTFITQTLLHSHSQLVDYRCRRPRIKPSANGWTSHRLGVGNLHLKRRTMSNRRMHCYIRSLSTVDRHDGPPPGFRIICKLWINLVFLLIACPSFTVGIFLEFSPRLPSLLLFPSHLRTYPALHFVVCRLGS